MNRAILACVLCLFLVSPLRADLDPQTKEPYRLTVVLHVANHRLLTPLFKNQLRSDLSDSLQAAFGKVADVTVVDEHPALKDIDSRGLQAVLDSLDKAGTAKPGKTHFVCVNFVDGQYEIQAGQYDGLTSLTTPMVRCERTADRQYVARLAAQMVQRDFGIVGTVGKRLDGGKVEVTLKGSQLGVPLDAQVAVDEVFAVAEVSRAGSGERAARVDESFLQVVEAPRDGVCVCRLLNRYSTREAKLGEAASTLGYRCLKLGTSAEPVPLRLRLIDGQGVAQFGLQIAVSRNRIEKSEDFISEGSTDRDGGRDTKEKYKHLAIVRVLKPGNTIAQIPVPVFEGRTVVCRVNVSNQDSALGLLVLRKRNCVDRMTDALLVQDDLRKEIGDLTTKSKLADAVKKAKEGLEALDRDISDLSGEFTSISAEAAKIPNKPRFTLADGEQRLDEMRAARAELHKYVAELDDALGKWKNDTKRREVEEKLLAARNFRRAARYDDAIQAYQDAIDKHGPNEGIKKELDELKNQWTIKDDEHRQARRFIFEIWPRMNTPQRLRDRMEDAVAAFEVCKKHGDKLTVQKLGMANVVHDGTLSKQLKALRPEFEDDRRTAEVIEKVAGELQKLHQDVLDYLGVKKPAAKDEKR